MAHHRRTRRRPIPSALEPAHRFGSDDAFVGPDEDDDDLGDCWIAHDEPGRPFTFGMWLCDCASCLHALRGEVAARPDTAMVLETTTDRVVVTAAQLLDALERNAPEILCRPGDDVREIFVASRLLQPRRRRD